MSCDGHAGCADGPNTRCSRCGTLFVCGFAAGQSRCWCFDQPVVAIQNADAGCCCPQCLAALQPAARAADAATPIEFSPPHPVR
uniref:Cysteine-rich CWC family protein n=1 Tax=Schlesneria paludicola TaxID=360056 RepID=A0A7C2JZF8_9PLAN